MKTYQTRQPPDSYITESEASLQEMASGTNNFSLACVTKLLEETGKIHEVLYILHAAPSKLNPI